MYNSLNGICMVTSWALIDRPEILENSPVVESNVLLPFCYRITKYPKNKVSPKGRVKKNFNPYIVHAEPKGFSDHPPFHPLPSEAVSQFKNSLIF